ncbi:MAG TPA: protein phosphatase 2C domain-containing protein [Candidatus Saccharimonadales bacterium]
MSPERRSGPQPVETEHPRVTTEVASGGRHAQGAEGGKSVDDILNGLQEDAKQSGGDIAIATGERADVADHISVEEIQQRLATQEAERQGRADAAREEALQTAESAAETSPRDGGGRRHREDGQESVFERFKDAGIRGPEEEQKPVATTTSTPPTPKPTPPKPAPPKSSTVPNPSQTPPRPPKAEATAPAQPPKAPEASKPPTSREREKTAERKVESITVASMTEPKHDKYIGMQTSRAREKRAELEKQGINLDERDVNDPNNAVRFVKKWEANPIVPPEQKKPNQDDILVDKARGLFVIADGMGGHAGGEIASRMIVDTFKRPQAYDRLSVDPKLAATELATNFDIARAKLRDSANQDPNLNGMGAAVVAAQIVNGNQLVFASAGDAMIGVFRPNANDGKGRLDWITSEQCKGNKVYNAVSTNPTNGREVHRNKSLDMRKDETGQVTLEPGDRVVMVSDGILGDYKGERLSFAEYKAALELKDPKDAMRKLYVSSKKYDDSSIIIFDYEGTMDASEAAKNMPTAPEAQDRGWESLSGHVEWPTDDEDEKTPSPIPTKPTSTPPTPPVAPPPTANEITGEIPQLMSPELFNKISLLRAEKEADLDEKDILEGITADLKGLLVDSDDPSQIDRLVDLIGQRRMQESLMFDMLADVQEEETGRRKRKMSKLVRNNYHNSITGGEQWVYDDEDPDKKPALKDLPNLDDKIKDLKEEIIKGYNRKYKRQMKELFAELETVGVNAWEATDIDGRVRHEAEELARQRGDANTDRYEARMKTMLGWDEERWRMNAEMVQLEMRNNDIISREFNNDMYKDMLRSDMNIAPNPAIREARFLKFIVDQVAETGERTPGNEVGFELSRSLLNTQIEYFLELNGIHYEDARFPGHQRRLRQMALDFLSAKELTETPEQYLARPQDIDVAKMRRYNTEARGNLRKEMNVATAHALMRELYDANRLADEYDAQQQKVRKLEARGATIPGQLRFARNRLNKLGQRLAKYKTKMGVDRLTHITEG